MTTKLGKRRVRKKPITTEKPEVEQPLLRSLIAEANRRGDTIEQLARALGVSYGRLAQWRRNESAIAGAQVSVHESAARYLGVPTVIILVLAGVVTLGQFVWPQRGGVSERVGRELARLRRDPLLGPFVPAELGSSAPEVQLFVAFLFHELGGDGARGEHTYRWFTSLHSAALGHAEAQAEIEALRTKVRQERKFLSEICLFCGQCLSPHLIHASPSSGEAFF